MLKKIARLLYNSFRLEINSFYDYIKFKKYYSVERKRNKSEKNLKAWILQDLHRIEKALTLPFPRLFFGKEVITRLYSNLKKLDEDFNRCEEFYLGISALHAYKEYHTSKGAVLSEELLGYLEHFDHLRLPIQSKTRVGVDKLHKPIPNFEESFKELAFSRKSIRNFKPDKVPHITLKKSIELAITAPSVCNRQHWRIDFVDGKLKDQVLALQNGNSGFKDTIQQLAIISSDMSAFYSGDERNQMYTDGGIFTMNFLYALQSLGISTCTLNWSASTLTELKFAKLSILPRSSQVIVLVAFGYADESSFTANSPKLSIGNFYKIHYEK